MQHIHNKLIRYSIPLLVLLSTILASCASQAGTALAQKACVEVNKSIAIYNSAMHTTNPTTRNTLLAHSLALLRTALPTSAVAAGENPSWQALSATLSESSRVPESYIVHALSRECTVIDSGASSPPPPQPVTETQPLSGSNATPPSGSSDTGSNTGNNASHSNTTPLNTAPSTRSNNSYNVPVKKTLSKI